MFNMFKLKDSMGGLPGSALKIGLMWHTVILSVMLILVFGFKTTLIMWGIYALCKILRMTKKAIMKANRYKFLKLLELKDTDPKTYYAEINRLGRTCSAMMSGSMKNYLYVVDEVYSTKNPDVDRLRESPKLKLGILIGIIYAVVLPIIVIVGHIKTPEMTPWLVLFLVLVVPVSLVVIRMNLSLEKKIR